MTEEELRGHEDTARAFARLCKQSGDDPGVAGPMLDLCNAVRHLQDDNSRLRTTFREANSNAYTAALTAAMLEVERLQDGCLPEGFAALEANAEILRSIKSLPLPKELRGSV